MCCPPPPFPIPNPPQVTASKDLVDLLVVGAKKLLNSHRVQVTHEGGMSEGRDGGMGGLNEGGMGACVSGGQGT